MPAHSLFALFGKKTSMTVVRRRQTPRGHSMTLYEKVMPRPSCARLMLSCARDQSKHQHMKQPEGVHTQQTQQTQRCVERTCACDFRIHE